MKVPWALAAPALRTLSSSSGISERNRDGSDGRRGRIVARSLANVKYDTKKGYFELGSGRKARALSVNTVKNFAQTLRLMAISKEMVENSDFATKREAYYVSKNWV